MSTLATPFHDANTQCNCPFAGAVCGSMGPEDAPIVIIGEAPTYQDMTAGRPFSGPAGNLLRQNIDDSWLDKILFMHAVDCVPINATRDKYMDTAINACHGNVYRKIAAHPRKAIICLGNYAVRSVTNNASLKITQIRGQRIDSELAEHGIFPLIHPIALARGTGSYRQWQLDLATVFDIVENGKDSRQYTMYTRHDIPRDFTQEQVDSLFSGTTEATCDIETTGFNFRKDRILQIGITLDKPRREIGYVFYPETIHLLKKALEKRTIKWNYHNGKFDVKFLRTYGIHAVVGDDTMLMSYALNEEGGIHDLDTVAADVLGAPNHKDVLKPYLKGKNKSYADVPPDVLATYLVADIGKTSQIRAVYAQRIRRDSALRKLYEDTLIPASDYLAWIESNGIYADQDMIAENQAYYTGIQDEATEVICRLNGASINPGSWQQVAHMLYNTLKLPNRWKGGTSADILKKLQKLCPKDSAAAQVLDQLLLYRTAAKMNGTYCRGWLEHIHPDNGRIHTTYKIHGTRTGRLSSSEPNVQNIPRLARIRGQVIASPGHVLMECDFSQAELRLLAALSGDPLLCEIFNTGGDPHSDLAEFLYPGWYERNKRAEETGDPVLKALCKEQRTKCKNVNFGIIYGITEFGLAEQINGTPAEAKIMLAGWFERYSVAAAFIKSCRATVIRNQVMTTCFGRKKRNGVVSRMNLAGLENEAANFPEQSIASDFTLMAGIRVWQQLRDMCVMVVNTVHDSIINEVPDSPIIICNAAGLITGTMQQIPRDYNITQVPFEADVETGHRWGALKKYHEHIAA